MHMRLWLLAVINLTKAGLLVLPFLLCIFHPLTLFFIIFFLFFTYLEGGKTGRDFCKVQTEQVTNIFDQVIIVKYTHIKSLYLKHTVASKWRKAKNKMVEVLDRRKKQAKKAVIRKLVCLWRDPDTGRFLVSIKVVPCTQGWRVSRPTKKSQSQEGTFARLHAPLARWIRNNKEANLQMNLFNMAWLFQQLELSKKKQESLSVLGVYRLDLEPTPWKH